MCDVGKRSSMNKYWSALRKRDGMGHTTDPASKCDHVVKGMKVSWNPKDQVFPEEKYKATSFVFQEHPEHNSEKERKERHEQAENSLTPPREVCFITTVL